MTDAPVANDLFVADIHLDAGTTGRRRQFLRFLRRHGPGARRLFILGDLFNAWIGYKQLRDADVVEVIDALRRLSDGGVEVHFVAGNRDFYSLDRIAKVSGMTTHAVGFETESFGRWLWLCHGHSLYRHDRHTHNAQSITHSGLVEWIFATLLPASLARFLADGYQHHSSRVVAHKPRRAVSISDEALVDYFQEGYDAVICGHSHQLRHIVYRLPDGREGHFCNLGAWNNSHPGPHFLRHGPDGFHFHHLDVGGE